MIKDFKYYVTKNVNGKTEVSVELSFSDETIEDIIKNINSATASYDFSSRPIWNVTPHKSFEMQLQRVAWGEDYISLRLRSIDHHIGRDNKAKASYGKHFTLPIFDTKKDAIDYISSLYDELIPLSIEEREAACKDWFEKRGDERTANNSHY